MNWFQNLLNRQAAIDSAVATVDKRPVEDGLENVVAGMGTTRDKRSYTTYTTPVTLTPVDLANMYRSSWLSKAIVNAPADDMTRKWRVIKFDEKQQEQQKAFLREEQRLQLQNKINLAIRWARLYGGSVIVIVLKGESADTLSRPFDLTKVKKDQLANLVVLDKTQLSPSEVQVTDPLDSAFGLPIFYTINNTNKRVHYTRVVRFIGEKIPYEVWKLNGYWDDSSLQHAYSTVCDADTTCGSIATMMFEANVDVVRSPNLADRLATPTGEQQVTKRYQLAAMMKSFNRLFLLDKDEEYDKKTNSFTNLSDIMQQFIVNVSGASGIPVTRLMGTSAKGLNATGEGDLRNYYDMISNKQEAELRAQLEYLDQVILRSATGAFPDDYQMTFNSLWQMSDAEKATMEKTKADRDNVYMQLGIISGYTVAQQLKADGTYSQLTEEDVELLKDLVPTATEEPEDEEDATTGKEGEKTPPGEKDENEDKEAA